MTSLQKREPRLTPELLTIGNMLVIHLVSIYFIDNVARDHLTVGKISIPIARQYYKRVIEQLNVIE